MPEASRRTIALDPDAGALPEGLLLPPEQGGEVVAFVVDPQMRAWAPSALFALARGWSDRGRDCLVVDADFAGPTLPPGSAVAPREGLSDALFYGASVDRVAVDVPGQPFAVIPAGTVVPDAAHAWAHGAWNHLLARLRSEGRVVLLMVPGNREGAAPLLARADRGFRIGVDPSEGPDAFPLIHPASHSLRPDPGTESPPAPMEEMSPRTPRPVDGLTRPDQAFLAPKTRQVAGTTSAASARSDATEAGPSDRPGGRRSLPWLLLVLVVLVLALLGAAWMGWLEIPGLELPGRTALAG